MSAQTGNQIHVHTLDEIFTDIENCDLVSPTITAIRTLNAVATIANESTNLREFAERLTSQTDAILARAEAKLRKPTP